MIEKEGFYPWVSHTPPGHCRHCGNEIRVAIFKGGIWCSDKCRKALGYDLRKVSK